VPRRARIGRVLRATGLKGDLKIELFRPRRGAKESGSLFLETKDGAEREHRVVRARFVDPLHAVVKLEAVDDRTKAEALHGAAISIDLDREGAALSDDVDPLLFARAVDAESGRDLGVIANIQDNGAQAILAIAPPDGGEERLVPFVGQLVAGIEEKDGAIFVRIRTIPGLFSDEDVG
jgi:16S rRNA processing protein RimM